VLAEDHPAIREKLLVRLRLESDLDVIAALGDGKSALHSARTQRPDVLLLDENMPGLLGSQVADLLYEEGNRVGIVLLSADPGIAKLRLPPTVVRRVLKDRPDEILIAALREAAAFTRR
jgi:DNA-binding NarL/FixJ family response regulator